MDTFEVGVAGYLRLMKILQDCLRIVCASTNNGIRPCPGTSLNLLRSISDRLHQTDGDGHNLEAEPVQII